MLKELFQNGGKMQAKQVHIESTRGTDPEVCIIVIADPDVCIIPTYQSL